MLSAVTVGAGLALSACAPTARTAGPYRAHAARAVESVESSVQSDLILLRAVARDHTTAAYVSVATSDAEDAASSAASSFLSIQPPETHSEQLRAKASDLLDEATSVLGEARIEARRGDRRALLGLRPRLQIVAVALDRLRSSIG
jgi:hypothetical protein